MIALNFAADEEASDFYRTAIQQVSNRTKRRLNQQNQNGNGQMEFDVQMRSNGPKAFIPQPTPSENGRIRKKPTRKLTKADISMPTNFEHIAHIGWEGKNLSNRETVVLSEFLKKAGVSESQMNNRETRQYIYDFIDTNKILDSAQSNVRNYSLNNKPKINFFLKIQNANMNQRSAPPPPPSNPPSSRALHRSPQSNKNNHRVNTVPRPPTQINSIPSGAAIPPPPPPPPPMPMVSNVVPNINIPQASSQRPAMPVVDDGRDALLASIRNGITLKSVSSQKDNNGNENSRDGLLNEIRQGKELRPAADRESPPSAGGTDALADALRRALQERSKALCSSDEEGDSSENDEWAD